MTDLDPKALIRRALRDAFGAGADAVSHRGDWAGPYADRETPKLMAALSALPKPADEAEVVRELRAQKVRSAYGYMSEKTETVHALDEKAANLIEAQSATIAQLQGEIKQLRAERHTNLIYIDKQDKDIAAAEERADRAVKVLRELYNAAPRADHPQTMLGRAQEKASIFLAALPPESGEKEMP